MQIWTTVATVVGDLLSIAGAVITLIAAARANNRPQRRQRRRR